MKSLLSLILLSFSAFLGVCAWIAVQVQPDRDTSTADLPKRAAEVAAVHVTDAVASTAVNPAQVCGAAIHRRLASLPG